MGLKSKIFILFLIVLFPVGLCYAGTGLESNLANWGEDQNRYNDIFAEMGLFHWIDASVLKTMVGQENRNFKPGLPQQGGGPAKGLGQIEDDTYMTILTKGSISTNLSKYNWEWVFKYQMWLTASPKDKAKAKQDYLNYIKSQYPRLSRQEYNDRINSGGFTEAELRQMAKDEIDLLATYYKYILDYKGGGKEGHLIQNEIERAGITGAGGYNQGPETLKQLKKAIVEIRDSEGKK